MAITRTTNLKLAKPGAADRDWGPVLNGNWDEIDGAATVSALRVSPAQIPSTTGNVSVAPGRYLKADGTVGTYAGGTVATNASGDSYVSLNPATGAVTMGTAWPSTPHVPLAITSRSGSGIGTIIDARTTLQTVAAPVLPLAGATMDDGATIAATAGVGLKIGGAATQKLGFYGKAPVVRPAMPAATAAASYGANEQTMLNAVYNAIRALGLGG